MSDMSGEGEAIKKKKKKKKMDKAEKKLLEKMNEDIHTYQ